jgi:hypothetical protein
VTLTRSDLVKVATTTTKKLKETAKAKKLKE